MPRLPTPPTAAEAPRPEPPGDPASALASLFQPRPPGERVPERVHDPVPERVPGLLGVSRWLGGGRTADPVMPHLPGRMR